MQIDRGGESMSKIKGWLEDNFTINDEEIWEFNGYLKLRYNELDGFYYDNGCTFLSFDEVVELIEVDDILRKMMVD
jgi:hypothetical protein